MVQPLPVSLSALFTVPGGDAPLGIAGWDGGGPLPGGGRWTWQDRQLDVLVDQRMWLTGAQWSNFLGPTAQGYEVWRRRSLGILTGAHFPVASELALVAALLPPRGVVLDLAASTGLYGRMAAGAPETDLVVVNDLAPAMLAEARRRWTGGPAVVWVRAEGQALPLASGSVDRVYCGGSLNEMTRPWAVLAEVRRVLRRDGGALFMSLAPATTVPGRLAQLAAGLGGVRFYGRVQLEDWARAAGLRVAAWEQYGVVSFWVVEPAA